MTSCFQSPIVGNEDIYPNDPSQIDNWMDAHTSEYPIIWKNIDRLTIRFIMRLGGDVPEDKKEKLKTVVREYFIANLKNKIARTHALKAGELDQKTISKIDKIHYALRLDISRETGKRAKPLLDRKAYRTFDKILKSYLPRERVSFRDDSNWMDTDSHMPPMDGSSRYDGRGGN